MANAVTLIKNDHKTVKKLLDDLSETSDGAVKTRQRLLEKLELEIRVHTNLEEEILYPSFRDAAEEAEDQKLYYEAVEEHNVADLVLKDMKKSDIDSPAFAGKVKVLKDLLLHHIEEEEEELLPKVSRLFSSEELEEMGERIEGRKKELLTRLSNGKSAQRHAP